MDDVRIDGGSDAALAAFVCSANDALTFRIVRNEADLPHVGEDENGESDDKGESCCFHPDMTHQIYGQREKILGYRDLSVRLWLSCSTFKCFASVAYSDALPESESQFSRDELLPPLLAIMSENQMCRSRSEFAKSVISDADHFEPVGSLVQCFKDDNNVCYELYRAQVDEPGVREHHQRLQFWLMFYVDGASFIDDADAKWNFYFLYEKFKPKDSSRKASYAVVGYCTVYHYYAYPDRMRPRISQMLILPPFQKRGLGAFMVDSIQRQYWKRDDVVDITVEDPADDFIRLRDFVDARNAAKLPSFAPALLTKGFSPEMLREANEELKLCRKQARRAYEILRLKNLNIHDKDMYKAFRVDVKRRLNAPYRKEDREMAKLRMKLKPEEFAAASMNITNREQRIESLRAQYNELEEHLQQVVRRLEKQ